MIFWGKMDGFKVNLIPKRKVKESCPSTTKFWDRNEHGKRGGDVVKDRALETFNKPLPRKDSLETEPAEIFPEEKRNIFRNRSRDSLWNRDSSYHISLYGYD